MQKTAEDQLVTGRFEGLDIAFSYAVTTAMVNDLVIRHDCDPTAAHLFGRAITGALLAAAILPEHHRLNACWRYQGLLRTILVDAGQNGTVRGLISPNQFHAIEAQLDKDQLFGDLADLQVVRSHHGRIVASGTTPISFQDVDRDLAYFFCISDQVESAINAMIRFHADPQCPVSLCRGMMIQALPGSDLQRFDRLRSRMDEHAFRSHLGLAKPGDTHVGTITRDLVDGESGYEGLHMESRPTPRFVCTCRRESMGAVLRTLSSKDREEILAQREPVNIRCQFCNQSYALSMEECMAAWNAPQESN